MPPLESLRGVPRRDEHLAALLIPLAAALLYVYRHALVDQRSLELVQRRSLRVGLVGAAHRWLHDEPVARGRVPVFDVLRDEPCDDVGVLPLVAPVVLDRITGRLERHDGGVAGLATHRDVEEADHVAGQAVRAVQGEPLPLAGAFGAGDARGGGGAPVGEVGVGLGKEALVAALVALQELVDGLTLVAEDAEQRTVGEVASLEEVLGRVAKVLHEDIDQLLR